jgi:hypothetical protein
MPSYCSVRTNLLWDDKNCSWLVLFHFSYFSKLTYISDKSSSLVIIILKRSEFLFLRDLHKFLSFASGLGRNSLLNWMYLQSNALLTLNKIHTYISFDRSTHSVVQQSDMKFVRKKKHKQETQYKTKQVKNK